MAPPIPTPTLDQLDARATAARALQRRFTLWLAIELAGLLTTVHFGWEGLLQPVIAAGLVLRIAASGAFLSALETALPRLPQRQGALGFGLGALFLSLFLVIDFIPPPFTEAGWDALLGLLIAIGLFAVPTLTAARLTRHGVSLQLPAVVRAAQALPLLMAVALVTVVPVIARELVPTPWIGWGGALLFAVLAAVARILSISTIAFFVFGLGVALVALLDHADTRAFAVAPAAITVLTAGIVFRTALMRWREAVDRMHDGAIARMGRPGPDLVPTVGTHTKLSEDEASALVDRELGLDVPAATALRQVSTDEAAAITTPFELHKPSPTIARPPQPMMGDWAPLARQVARLLVAVIGGSLLVLFASLAALTPLATATVFSAIFHTLIATSLAVAAATAASVARPATTVAGNGAPLLVVAAVCAGLAAGAVLARAFVSADLQATLASVAGTLAWVFLGAMLTGLRALTRPLAADKLAARFRILLVLVAILGAFGLGSALHAALAPGDIAWLAAPLHAAMVIIGIGLLLGLAYTVNDARVRFEDEAIRARLPR